MGDDRSGQMGFQHNGDRMFNCPSSGMSLGYSSGPGWDHIVSLSQNENFGPPAAAAAASSMTSPCEFANPSYLVHYPSHPNPAEMVQKLPVFGGGNFSEMVNSFGLAAGGQTSTPVCHSGYTLTKSGVTEKSPKDAQPLGASQILEDRAIGSSPNGKRKTSESCSPINPDKDMEGGSQKELSGEASEPKESNGKKQKTDQNAAGSKQAGKQVKEGSQGGDDPKGNYIHVRARRGQATNSHSLAERVRREKISERMRLLQELVPGCNKITGKAVMLDEIINYVQSLQQQVEFLSMKLATVNPELNLDIERILSKDVLNSRAGGASIAGFNPGITSHPYLQGFHQGAMASVPATTSQYHPISQAMWDTDLQTLLHMGFDPNSTVGNLGPNGSSKTEL